MKIDLLDLDVDVKYNSFGPETGGSHPHGGEENFGASVSIYSVVANGIEIIGIIPGDQLEEMEKEILENL